MIYVLTGGEISRKKEVEENYTLLEGMQFLMFKKYENYLMRPKK